MQLCSSANEREALGGKFPRSQEKVKRHLLGSFSVTNQDHEGHTGEAPKMFSQPSVWRIHPYSITGPRFETWATPLPRFGAPTPSELPEIGSGPQKAL